MPRNTQIRCSNNAKPAALSRGGSRRAREKRARALVVLEKIQLRGVPLPARARNGRPEERARRRTSRAFFPTKPRMRTRFAYAGIAPRARARARLCTARHSGRASARTYA